MLTVRKEQNDVLAKHSQRRFEDKVIVHVKKFWPEQCRTAGDDGIRLCIQEGLERAQKYGVYTEYDGARFVDLMYSLGISFDTDPALPWASETLRDEDLSPRAKMDKLYRIAENGTDVEREQDGDSP